MKKTWATKGNTKYKTIEELGLTDDKAQDTLKGEIIQLTGVKAVNMKIDSQKRRLRHV